MFLACLLLASPCKAQGNTPNYYFDHYRLPEGYNAKSSRDVIQDKTGYIYITNENGLVRYNGHQFKYYREDKSNPKALQASYCVFMEKDPEDKIWLMAGPELQIFDPKTESFELLRKQTMDTTAAYHPYSLRYDGKNKKMWVACADGLYYCNDGERKLIQVPNPDSLYDNYLRDLVVYNDKVYGANDTGLIIYDIKSGKLTFHNLMKTSLGGDYLGGFELYVKDEKHIYISTWNKGIILYDPINQIIPEKIPFSNPEKEHNGVLSLHKDKDSNKLWVGTLVGLYTFDLDTHKYTPYRTDDIAAHDGIRGAVNNFMYDDQGGLWICGGEGLFRLDFNKQFVSSHLISFLQNKDGSYSPGAFTFERNNNKKDSIVWIQIYYKELYRYDLINKKEIPLPPKIKKFGKRTDLGVFNLVIDSQNRLWYMTKEFGLMVYDIAKDIIVIPPGSHFYHHKTWAVNIFENKDGDILICTYDGLYKMTSDNMIAEYKELNQFLRKNDFRYIRMVDEDKEGNIILAKASDSHSITANVLKYNPVTHAITSLSKKDCPAFDKITKMEFMIVNKEDQVFIGSYNGVAILNTDLDCSKVRYFNSENGLTNESIYNFEESYDGRVWYNHEFGLTQYIPKYDYHQHVTYYNSALSMTRAYTTMSPNTGILYTGINKGFELIDVNKIKEQNPKSLIISHFSIDNKPLQYSGGKIVVSHKDFPIHIDVSLLQYTNSNTNTYEYSINEEKKYTLDGNTLKFDKLPAGTYHVKISGKNFYGREAHLKEIIIKVLPPFYQSWWFVTLSALSFALTVFYYFKLKDQHRQNLTKIRDNISKDLHDDLGSNLMHIKLISELEMIKKTEADKNTFKVISEEIKVVLDNMSDIVWLTQSQFDHLEDLVARIRKLAVDLLEKKGMEVIWHKDDLSSIKVDVNTRKQCYLALKEIINNCGKYSQANKVWITIMAEAKEIILTIADDGIGYNPSAATTGNGLVNIKMRIRDCGGTIDVFAAPAQGVKYVIKIPLK